MKIVLEFSGEHPGLPLEEAKSVFICNIPSSSLCDIGKRTAVWNVPTNISTQKLTKYLGRLALSQSASSLICTSSNFDDITQAAAKLKIPPGTFRVRTVFYDGMFRGRLDTERDVGRAIPAVGRVNLTNPDTEYRLIHDGQYSLGRRIWRINRPSFEDRIPKYRPFFSPVTLHPKYARALVNLSRIKRGRLILDPFCGTGGILIEAGLIGARLAGSDFQQSMVSGTEKNLAQHGLKSRLVVCDIGDMPDRLRAMGIKEVDAVATDPPYGRAATTGKEDINSLYSRAFEAAAEVLKKGAYAAVVIPSERLARLSGKTLRLESMHQMRVHRSLTRHFCVFRRV